MQVPRVLPRALAIILVINAVLLWAGVMFEVKILGVFYFTLLFVALAVVVVSLTASVAYSLGRLEYYWTTFYPSLFAIALLGYAVLKLPIQSTGLAVAAGAFILGCGISSKLREPVLRFMPVMTIILFLVFGTIGVVRETQVSIYALCIGLLLVPIIKHRNESW